jgi:hypothetical protein
MTDIVGGLALGLVLIFFWHFLGFAQMLDSWVLDNSYGKTKKDRFFII